MISSETLRSTLRLTDAQRLDWLRLTRTESIGPLTFTQLINRFGGAGAALAALPDLLKARGKGHIRITTREAAEQELEAAEALGARFVAIGEPDYPLLLRTVAGAPPLLAVLGDPAVFRHPFVAIVGSRNASGVGRSFTEKLAAGLTRHRYGIVSGLARGIDTAAHSASLGFGTVAVLAGGLDRPYPPENVALMRRIAETGAVVSEMPFGWEARGRDFPRRNRIISGIAYATVIVEAARKSGSLITARFALEQNREVFAVPGSPLDPRAEGANDLIREGAHLCASVEDVVRELEPIVHTPDLFAPQLAGEEQSVATYRHEPLWDELLEPGFAEPVAQQRFAASPEEAGEGEPGDSTPDAPPRERILAVLGPSPLDLDDLVRLSGASLAEVQGVLIDLDLDGRIERHGGNRVSLTGA